MRLRTKNIGPYPGYKVCGVQTQRKSVADRHEKAFLEFVQRVAGVSKLPRRVDKKHGAWYSEQRMFPPVRGYARLLIPEPGKYPCDVCQFARYNAACRMQEVCVPYMYHLLSNTDSLNNKKLVSNIKFEVPNDSKKGRKTTRCRKGARSGADKSVSRKSASRGTRGAKKSKRATRRKKAK